MDEQDVKRSGMLRVTPETDCERGRFAHSPSTIYTEIIRWARIAADAWRRQHRKRIMISAICRSMNRFLINENATLIAVVLLIKNSKAPQARAAWSCADYEMNRNAACGSRSARGRGPGEGAPKIFGGIPIFLL